MEGKKETKTFLFERKEANYRTSYRRICAQLNDLLRDDNKIEFLKIIRHGCLNDLFFLMYFVLNIPDINNPWLVDRIREVEEKNDRTVDLWAREMWKSSIITYALTIQEILRDKEIRIGIFSHTRDIAKAFHRRIMQTLATNKLLKTAFEDVLYKKPETESPKWSEEGLIVKRDGSYNECTVESWGLIDHMPTSKHFSLRIYDDIITDASVNTPEQVKKAEQAFRLSHNLGTRGGKVRVIGTIYDFGDIHMKLKTDESWYVRVHPAEDEEGNPQFFTQEELEQKKKDQGAWVYACQMLLNPVQLSAMQLLKEWFKTYSGKPPEGRRFIVCDPAGSKGKKNDYTVMWVVSVDSLGNYFIVDGVRDRLNLSERWNKLKGLVKKWNRIIKVGYEKYGLQSDIEFFREKMQQESLFFPIQELGGAMSKTNRIQKLQPYFEEQRIYFPESLWYDDMEGKRHDLTEEFFNEEYMAWPSPAHDDMLDCLARTFDEKMSVKPIKKEESFITKKWSPFLEQKSLKNNWMSA